MVLTQRTGSWPDFVPEHDSVMHVVGRESELAWLETQAMTRTPPCVSVEGPDGAGRTTILRTLAERLMLRGHPVVWVDGAELPKTAPERFVRAVRDGIVRRASRGGVVLLDDADVLAARLPQLVSDLARDVATTRVPLFVGRGPGSAEWLTPLCAGRPLTSLAVPDLQPAAVVTYLQRRQVLVGDAWEVVARTHGHPLLVALVADVAVATGEVQIPAADFDTVARRLSRRLLRGTAHVGIRIALSALALGERLADDDFAAILGEDRFEAAIAGLKRLAVVDHNVAGYALHPLVRDGILADDLPATKSLLEQTKQLLAS